jgi:hypothetical protein
VISSTVDVTISGVSTKLDKVSRAVSGIRPAGLAFTQARSQLEAHFAGVRREFDLPPGAHPLHPLST